MTSQKFCEYVDFLTDLYRLDPALPELAELKAEAEQIVGLDIPSPQYFLAMLNPRDDIRDYDGVAVLEERMFGHVLRPWSLARYDCPRSDEELVRIVVDGQGAHRFEGSGMGDREDFWVRGAAINSHRLADPGNRYEIACEIIREFTGLQLLYTELVGNTRTITVTKDQDGAWLLELDRVPTISS